MANVLLSTKNVGDTIKIKENGSPVSFTIVHKGSPDTSKYVGFDNGVVVLRTDIHSKGVYDSSNNDYANSDLHAWGNGTYLNSIDEDVRNQIMQVKIPYRKGTSGSSVSAGANGLSCKVFFLSTKEVDSTESYSPNEGAVFSYFKGGGNSKRIARYNGQPDHWWLRSPNSYYDYVACLVFPSGDVSSGSSNVYSSYGRRPAFVLPSSLYVSDDGSVITNAPPSAPGSISVSSVVGGGTTSITVTAATDSDGSIANYQFERSIDGASYTVIATQAGLVYNDSISNSWGTVQYRVCAIDNMGATGPYVTSEKYTVQEGYITIGGPSPSMGTKDNPFTFTATIGVSGLTGIIGIHVRAWVDSYAIYDDTINQGAEVSFEVDTRSMSAGSHTIRVIAEHDTVLSAMQDYTFSISEMTIPEGGRAEQFEDEYGTPIFPVTMAKNVVSPNGVSIQTEIENLRVQHHGTTGQLEHVDAVTGVTSYTLTREAGTTYACVLYPQVAAGTATPMLSFAIPSGFTGNVSLGSIGSVNATAANVAFTIPNTAILNISKYVLESPIT